MSASENGVSEKIPFWMKYSLTIEEAAAYFRIGEHKLRNLIAQDRCAVWILWNGNRAQIKRELFEQLLNETNAI